MTLLDAARASRPGWGFAVYAYEPGGGVTVEAHAPTGDVFSAAGADEAACWLSLFPDLAPPEEPARAPSVFD